MLNINQNGIICILHTFEVDANKETAASTICSQVIVVNFVIPGRCCLSSAQPEDCSTLMGVLSSRFHCSALVTTNAYDGKYSTHCKDEVFSDG